MLIWVLAAVLVGGFALIGHQSGAIRSGVGLIGIALGLALAGLLGGWIMPALAGMGVKDEVALRLLPGLIAFLVLSLVFFGIGVAVHRPVEHHFKYRTDEPTRQSFERTNQAIGLFVGLISGICVFFSVGKYVYRQGYLVVQTSSETGEAAPVQYLGKIRQDMESTGWAKTFAALDSTPAKFYEVSDILGILHGNPLVHGRVENYPPFLALAEAPEFTDIGGDQEYQKMLQDQPALAVLINHPKTLAVLNNPNLIDTFNRLDLKDFRQYIETGVSPRYEDERILGRWRMDPGSVFTSLKRQRLNTGPAEMKKIRETLTPILAGMTLIAYPDGRFSMKVAAPAAAPEPTAEATAAAEAAPDANAVRNSYLARYGIAPGATPPPSSGPAPASRRTAGNGPVNLPALTPLEGTWTRSEGRYLLNTEAGGSKSSLDAMVNDSGRLTWTFGTGDKKLTVFFVRTS
jgi:hypothetical protein